MNISPAVLFASLIFSALGFVIVKRGIKNANYYLIGIGGTLIGYTYFISNIWVIWMIGVGLCYAAKQYWMQ